MQNEENLNTLINELLDHGVRFNPACNQSLKQVLKQVSSNKVLYKKVCEVKKSYQRLKHLQSHQVHEPSTSIDPLTEQLSHIFNKWE